MLKTLMTTLATTLRRARDRQLNTELGAAVHDALALRAALRDQARQGFCQVLVRNPETGEERTLTSRRALALQGAGD